MAHDSGMQARWGIRGTHDRRWLVGCVGLCALAVAGVAPEHARAQDDGSDDATVAGLTMADPTKAPWIRLEAAIEKGYREPLKQGGAFEATVQEYLEKTVVPQLALDDNRAIIERVRKRMRELLLGGIADDKAFELASAAALEAMQAIAKNGQEPVPVRVNAALFIGEMRQKDNREGKLWPRAAEPLAKLAADTTLPAAVRIAAMAGLARHGDAAKAAGDTKVAEFAKASRGAIQAILGEKPADGGAVATDWMTGRALALLPGLTKNASKELAGAVGAILADDARPIDVRVRAAVALGAIAGAKSEVDADAVVKRIRALAVEALVAETDTADRLRFEDDYRALVGGRRRFIAKAVPPTTDPSMMSSSYDPGGFNVSGPPPGYPSSGGGEQITGGTGGIMPGGMPGIPGGSNEPVADYITEPACRRTAWRLHVLGDATLAEKGSGVGSLPGVNADEAKDLAESLREHAATIDEELTERAVRDALAALRGEEPTADDEGKPSSGRDAKDDDKKPGDKPRDSDSDPNSPFGN